MSAEPMRCSTPECTDRVIKSRIWCPKCQRLVKPDEWWAIRMANQSVCMSEGFWAEGETPRMWIWSPTAEGQWDGRSVNGAAEVAEWMRWVEYYLVREAISKLLRSRRYRQTHRRVWG